MVHVDVPVSGVQKVVIRARAEEHGLSVASFAKALILNIKGVVDGKGQENQN